MEVIIYGKAQSFFKVGEKVKKDGKDSEVIVDEIKVFFNRVTICFSDGSSLKFVGLPFSVFSPE